MSSTVGTVQFLIVEDNKTDALVLRKVIEDSALGPVRICRDGLDGLNSCILDTPDVLLLDLELPRLSGEEMLRMVRSVPRFQGIKVIIVSDLADSRRRELDMLGLGADCYLRKPVDFSQLLGALRDAASSSRTEVASNSDTGRHRRSTEVIQSFLSRSLEEAGTPLPVQPNPDDAASATSFSPGDNFRGYDLIEILGVGGMGTVYKARQQSLDRMVALKVLMKQTDATDAVWRFRRETRIMARLSHRNIVQIFDAGDTPMTLYIAMEFVGGGTLHQRLRSGPITLEEFRSLSIQTCNALSYLHSEGVIHRDIKPGNIFFTTDGTVKLGDFGISRAQTSAIDAITNREVLGTPRFMAPEVGRGFPGDELSDQYSLSKSYLRALAPSLKDIKAERVPERRDDIPDALLRVLWRASHTNPLSRYPSVAAFKDAIQRAL